MTHSPITDHLREALAALDACLHATAAEDELTSQERGDIAGLVVLAQTCTLSARRAWIRALERMTPDGGTIPYTAEELGAPVGVLP